MGLPDGPRLSRSRGHRSSAKRACISAYLHARTQTADCGATAEPTARFCKSAVVELNNSRAWFQYAPSENRVKGKIKAITCGAVSVCVRARMYACKSVCACVIVCVPATMSGPAQCVPSGWSVRMELVCRHAPLHRSRRVNRDSAFRGSGPVLPRGVHARQHAPTRRPPSLTGVSSCRGVSAERGAPVRPAVSRRLEVLGTGSGRAAGPKDGLPRVAPRSCPRRSCPRSCVTDCCRNKSGMI